MEKQKYIEKAEMFKVLSDSNRLQIIDMLSCGEMCACKILEKFNITQPTLSHHLKVLRIIYYFFLFQQLLFYLSYKSLILSILKIHHSSNYFQSDKAYPLFQSNHPLNI